MYAHVFTLKGEYKTSTQLHGVDLEKICNSVNETHLQEVLYKAVPRLASHKVTVSVSWIYNGFRVYINGAKLTEAEIDEFTYELDPLVAIGLCDMFWDYGSDNKLYTGLLMAYDNIHYFRFLVDGVSFVVLAHEGLDEFVELLEEKEPKLSFAFSPTYKKELLKNELAGTVFKADLALRNRRLTVKMHQGSSDKRPESDAKK